MSEPLTLAKASEILKKHVTEPHLFNHALAVSAAMGSMAAHFGEDTEHWKAVGYLHDVDFERFPEEHCLHVRELLEPEGVDEADIRAIESHGWELCCDVKPETELEKSLYTVDELTGIIMAAALMRPNGIADLEVKSAMKKFKDKKFAAKCDRTIIQKGCGLLGMELADVMGLCIEGMRAEMDALGLGPKQS
ncbi:MAG: hydrolase [Oscillospiraceae bacterium]|jgi:predicted hydrolase (HD superfamily)